jgi:hypothetical protein
MLARINHTHAMPFLRNTGNALPRTSENTNYTDPITLEDMTEDRAWYLAPNLTRNKKITALYKKSTLNELLRQGGKSPLTRKPFTKADIKKVPVTGELHPELKGGLISAALLSPDTSEFVIPKLQTSEVEHFILDAGPIKNEHLSVGKRRVGGYRMTCRLDLDFQDLKTMGIALRALGLLFHTSSTQVLVKRTMTKRKNYKW